MLKSITTFFLARYETTNYLILQKAKILLSISFISVLLITVMIIAGIAQNNAAPEIMMPLFIGCVVIIAALLLLRRGRFSLAAHAIFNVLLLTVWLTLFLERSTSAVEILDSVVFIPAILSMVPLIIVTHKLTTLFYYAMNAGILVFYSFYIESYLNFPGFDKAEYIVDNLVAFTVVAVMSYLIFSINQKANRKNVDLIAVQQEQNRRMADILATVEKGAQKLTSSAYDMSLSVTIFSDSTQTQASSIEEITATMEEITSNSDNIFSLTMTQNSALNEAIGKLQELYDIVAESENETRKITGIRDRLNSEAEATKSDINVIVNDVEGMTAEFKGIEDIVSMIDDISEKINLLSLNAAIEAARAGDAGRGFAVVADEISKLADQTAENVKTITSSIKRNISGLNSFYTALKSFVEVLDTMIAYIMQMSGSIDRISSLSREDLELNMVIKNNAGMVLDMAENIKTAMLEQKTATDEILKSMTSINNSTQEVAGRTGELKLTSQEVSHISDELENILKKSSEGDKTGTVE
ncbi:MAG TPA: methyl-accepting chemotaxis protein [Spirochaetota bacterium]|nr:methyl-accepting chemotaxis protein [Spirochaetota bacterium]HPI91370.1 methyl-accepting chemotaxis protein [Spirochaetota bacterium]HPR49640.1 methyl-accepting chemotaxis protein [Spirochaetota bacterium]